MTDLRMTREDRAAHWSRRAESLRAQIADCRQRIDGGEGQVMVRPGIDLALWLEMLLTELMEAELELELVSPGAGGELSARLLAPITPPIAASSDPDLADLEGRIANLRHCLPIIGDFIVPAFDKLASEVLADWDAEHRDLVAERDRLRAEERRKLQ